MQELSFRIEIFGSASVPNGDINDPIVPSSPGLQALYRDAVPALNAFARSRGAADFASLVVQYSTGPAAARGGDIGWVRAEDMVEPLRTAIVRLQPGETSPPIESKGLIHLFKRLP